MMAVVYVPLLARSYGAGSSTIGLLVGTYQAAALVSNLLFGRWADFGNRKAFVAAGTAVTGLALAAHLLVDGLPGLFLARALAGLCVGTWPSALVAYYYDRSGKLGRFTGFGSLGWGLGAVAAGAIAVGWLFPVAGILFGSASVVAMMGLRKQQVRLAQRFFDARVLRRNWHLYLAFYLRHAGAFSIWAVFPVFLADLGASRFWVGFVFALNPLSQVVFMNLLEPVRERVLIRAGLVLSTVVFGAFALAPDFRWVIPIQVVLALSWSLLYLGSLKRLMRRNPERSTAAGMFQSTFGLAAVSGALLTGLTGRFGYTGIMVGAMVLALAGTLVFLFVRPDRAGTGARLSGQEDDREPGKEQPDDSRQGELFFEEDDAEHGRDQDVHPGER